MLEVDYAYKEMLEGIDLAMDRLNYIISLYFNAYCQPRQFLGRTDLAECCDHYQQVKLYISGYHFSPLESNYLKRGE
jgi:hypothetical protein